MILPNLLVPVSLGYLALPLVIFFVGWLQPVWAILAVALLMAAVAGALWTVLRRPAPPDLAIAGPVVTAPILVAYLLICSTWLFLAGVGGYGYQDSDWIKHEAILKDLIDRPWPVVYEVFGRPAALVYYIAYYLPAALAGKWAGWGAANAVLYLWSLLGLMLAALWFAFLVRRASLGVMLLFVVSAGLDMVGQVLTAPPDWGEAIRANWRDLERWPTLMLQFNSTAELLFWVPHHALSGWLGAALVAYAAIVYVPSLLLLVVVLTSLWSPFAALGLLPLAVAGMLVQPRPWAVRLRAASGLTYLGAGLALALAGLYYAAKLMPVAPFLAARIPHGFVLAGAPPSPLGGTGELFVFALLEFGLYALLVAPVLRTGTKPFRWLLGASVATLAGLMVYRLGLNNDLAMRASIPALFLLAVAVGRGLTGPALPLFRRRMLLAAVLIGSVTPALGFARHIVPFVDPDYAQQTTEEEKGAGIVEFYAGDDLKRLVQYLGSYQSFFFQKLAQTLYATASNRRYVAFSDQILVAGYTLDPAERALPGTTVEVVLDLYVFTEVIDRNLSLSLRLIGKDGRELWREQGWPQNRPTSKPINAVAWSDTRRIPIPAGTPPGVYRLDLGVIDPESGDPVPAQALPSGSPLGEIVPLGYLEVGLPDLHRTVRSPMAVQLGEAIALAGADFQPDAEVAAGSPVTVTLRWEALLPIAQDYTGFVHLLDPAGNLVAQWDQPPLGGFLPTGLWRTGLTVSDVYPVRVPPEALPGTYTLVGGMYDWTTGIRLPVQIDGQPAGDTFRVGAVVVE